MRHRVLIVPLFALLAAGCGGNPGGSTTGGPNGLPAAQPNLPRFLRVTHTPAKPPAIRHRITGADRARARNGGWQPLANRAAFTGGPGTALLMTDGTVMVQDSCTPNWFALSPDKSGSYVNGTWTKKGAMPANYGPLYFGSAVLADGKLVVNGGEYNFCQSAETTLGAIYDPVADKWTALAPPSGWGSIGDAQSIVLADGTYMLGNCCSSVQALLNESTLTWTQVGNGKQDTNSEEGWTLLRDGTALVVNVFDPPFAQAYTPQSQTWSSAGQLPVNLISGFEIGPQTLMANNHVFVAGANGDTVVYRPGNKTWAQGPTFPVSNGLQLDVADGPATLLTDDTVMLPASPGLYNAPSSFFIYNGKTLVPIAGPPNAPNDSSYNVRLLMLPNGQVLETDGSSDVEIYTSAKSVKIAAPIVTAVPTALTRGTTYKLQGKRLNGVSQTNSYGDDAQQASNYPLVRIVNTATGHVVYARTHGHSFMGVGSTRVVSTNFDVPSTAESGSSTLVVVANGIASAPVAVTLY